MREKTIIKRETKQNEKKPKFDPTVYLVYIYLCIYYFS